LITVKAELIGIEVNPGFPNTCKLDGGENVIP